MTKKNGFKQSKNNDKYKGIFPFEFDESGAGGESVTIPNKIHLIPVGQWEHDLYGPIIINNADISEFIRNFNAGVRKGVFITAGHEGMQELPAVGWVKEVEARDDGLWGTVEWNSNGLESLSEKEYKFFSPEMCRDYEDPETHQYYRNVLTGGALTKSPYFKELQAIVFSDKNIKSNLKDKQKMSKTLEEVLALEVTALTDEDKAVLEANKEALNDEQKAKYFPEAPKAEEKAPEPAPVDPTPDPVPADPAPADDTIKASEKGNVVISASEYKILTDKADKGAQAFAELERIEVNGIVEKMLFSESNNAGKFLPKSKDSLRAFVAGLNKVQRVEFSALVGSLEVSNKFNELGASGNKAVEATATVEIETKVEAVLKDNPKMKYSEALKMVLSENKGLEERFDKELPAVKK